MSEPKCHHLLTPTEDWSSKHQILYFRLHRHDNSTIWEESFDSTPRQNTKQWIMKQESHCLTSCSRWCSFNSSQEQYFKQNESCTKIHKDFWRIVFSQFAGKEDKHSWKSWLTRELAWTVMQHWCNPSYGQNYIVTPCVVSLPRDC